MESSSNEPRIIMHASEDYQDVMSKYAAEHACVFDENSLRDWLAKQERIGSARKQSLLFASMEIAAESMSLMEDDEARTKDGAFAYDTYFDLKLSVIEKVTMLNERFIEGRKPRPAMKLVPERDNSWFWYCTFFPKTLSDEAKAALVMQLFDEHAGFI